MEAPAGVVLDVGRVELTGQIAPGRAGDPFPPRAGGLGAQPRGVGEQLSDRAVAERGPGQMELQPVVEVQQPLVAQSQHGNGRDRLADRPQAVLHVVVRFADTTASG